MAGRKSREHPALGLGADGGDFTEEQEWGISAWHRMTAAQKMFYFLRLHYDSNVEAFAMMKKEPYNSYSIDGTGPTPSQTWLTRERDRYPEFGQMLEQRPLFGQLLAQLFVDWRAGPAVALLATYGPYLEGRDEIPNVMKERAAAAKYIISLSSLHGNRRFSDALQGLGLGEVPVPEGAESTPPKKRGRKKKPEPGSVAEMLADG